MANARATTRQVRRWQRCDLGRWSWTRLAWHAESCARARASLRHQIDSLTLAGQYQEVIVRSAPGRDVQRFLPATFHVAWTLELVPWWSHRRRLSMGRIGLIGGTGMDEYYAYTASSQVSMEIELQRSVNIFQYLSMVFAPKKNYLPEFICWVGVIGRCSLYSCKSGWDIVLMSFSPCTNSWLIFGSDWK